MCTRRGNMPELLAGSFCDAALPVYYNWKLLIYAFLQYTTYVSGFLFFLSFCQNYILVLNSFHCAWAVTNKKIKKRGAIVNHIFIFRNAIILRKIVYKYIRKFLFCNKCYGTPMRDHSQRGTNFPAWKNLYKKKRGN